MTIPIDLPPRVVLPRKITLGFIPRLYASVVLHWMTKGILKLGIAVLRFGTAIATLANWLKPYDEH